MIGLIRVISILQLEKMTEAWEGWAAENGTYDRVCLINSKNKMIIAKDILQGGGDIEDVMDRVLDDVEKQRGGREEVQAMIDMIHEKYPNLMNELTKDDKDGICRMKKRSPEKTDAEILELAQIFLNPNITLEQIQAIECVSVA